MIETVILVIVLAVTVFILWLAKRHGIVMRAEADGLHEAEMRAKKEKGYHL